MMSPRFLEPNCTASRHHSRRSPGCRVRLRRAPRDEIGDASAYEYWTGEKWSSEAAAAVALWPVARPANAIEKLAAFEGGAHVTWSEHLGMYLAITNAGQDAVGIRTAQTLEGPWSELVPWLDCTKIVEPRVPYCYTPALHPQLSTGDGRFLVTLDAVCIVRRRRVRGGSRRPSARVYGP